MRGQQQGGFIGAEAAVLVTDEYGQPVAEATVYVTWLVSGEGGDSLILNQVDLTNDYGIARFHNIGGVGTYTLTVVNIVKPDLTFDPDNSVLVGTITLPPEIE